MIKVYGCIITPSGELQWSGDDAQDVLDQLLSMKGTQYGQDWTFPIDTGLEYSNVCVSNNANIHMVFEGEDTVYCLIQALKEVLESVV